MTRFDIMRILRQFKENNKDKYRILQMGLFGSVAKGTMGRESDVDVVVELEKQDLWHIIGIKQDLEEILCSTAKVTQLRRSAIVCDTNLTANQEDDANLGAKSKDSRHPLDSRSESAFHQV